MPPCRASGLFWHSLEVLPAVGEAARARDHQPMDHHFSCASEPSGCRGSGIPAPAAYRLAGEIASCERCREILSISFPTHFQFKVRVVDPTSRRDYRKSSQGGKRVRPPWRSTCDGAPRDKCVVGRLGFGREVVFLEGNVFCWFHIGLKQALVVIIVLLLSCSARLLGAILVDTLGRQEEGLWCDEDVVVLRKSLC